MTYVSPEKIGAKQKCYRKCSFIEHGNPSAIAAHYADTAESAHVVSEKVYLRIAWAFMRQEGVSVLINATGDHNFFIYCKENKEATRRARRRVLDAHADLCNAKATAALS
eukprot:5070373-Prymnesium_polylepis.2